MAIQEPPKLDHTLSAELEELERSEAELLAQLRKLKSGRLSADTATVGSVERRLIEIHGRKSMLRVSRHRITPNVPV